MMMSPEQAMGDRFHHPIYKGQAPPQESLDASRTNRRGKRNSTTDWQSHRQSQQIATEPR